MNKSKIAIIGSRGIPSKYGGFETFTEQISIELAKKGYKVFVSCEYLSKEDMVNNYKGVNLFYFPIKSPQRGIFRILYEFMYDAYSLFWASTRTDVVYMLGYSASFFFFIPKLFGKQLLVNPDGLEWKRSKFSGTIKILLKFCEKLMIFWTKDIIADSKAIKRYLDDRYGIKSHYIAYGVSEPQVVEWDSKYLPDLFDNRICPGKYWLVVARLEPENNIEMIIKGYLKSKTEKPLVIIGDFSSKSYKSTINKLIEQDKDNNIIFLGSVYNKRFLNMIRYNCFVYIHGHSVGGTNPSLLEAMIMKNMILAHDNEFNIEVCSDSAIYFINEKDLANKMDNINQGILNFTKYKNGVFDRAKKDYSWEKIYSEYDLYLGGSKNY